MYWRKNIDSGSLKSKNVFSFWSTVLICNFFSQKFLFSKKIVEIGQNGSKMLKIDTVSTYSTNCNSGKFLPIPPHTNRNGVLYRLLYTPWGFLSPFIKLWKGEFFKGWILDVGDGIFPNRMREGEGAASLFHMSWGGGGTFFYFF